MGENGGPLLGESCESEASVGASTFDKECRDGVTSSCTSGDAGSASVEGSSISNKERLTDAWKVVVQ